MKRIDFENEIAFLNDLRHRGWTLMWYNGLFLKITSSIKGGVKDLNLGTFLKIHARLHNLISATPLYINIFF
jgi:hypothetical protein